MFDSPHDRAFGVEIECGFPGGTDAARRLMSRTFGDQYGTWSVGADGTEVEIRTPILQGEEGFEVLKRAMEAIREANGYTTPSDGMHTHHDAPDFAENPELCLPLVRSWRENLSSIQAMVAPRRRNSYGACPEWSDQAFMALEQWANGETRDLMLGRNDLNLASLRRSRPSIEIRLHEGTLDGDVAVAWIQFGQRFLAEAAKRKNKMRKRDNDQLLLSGIKLSPEATAILLAKKDYSFMTPLSMYEDRRRRPGEGPGPAEQSMQGNDYYEYDDNYYEDDDYCCECCAGECGPDCCGEY